MRISWYPLNRKTHTHASTAFKAFSFQVASCKLKNSTQKFQATNSILEAYGKVLFQESSQRVPEKAKPNTDETVNVCHNYFELLSS